MKIEILLEPTSNKLMVEHAEFDESDTHVLERFDTSVRNHVKEIFLKLNLPDHKILKDRGEVKEFQRSFSHSDTERLSRSDEVLKLKNFKKDAALKLFKSTNQERFIDPEFPDHVYRLKKALYGLKQAPCAWYDKLSSFLIEHGFTKGIIDPTLFTRRHGEDILLVQVYVDDIIFGLTNPDFSKCFANLMKNNFEMSMMGELKFFLGLQVHQSPHGIFISQSQYAIELLKKHSLDECVSMSTHMATERLDDDLQGTLTDQTNYRRMIGGLMYLTASRPDIAFATFVCAQYQACPMVKHLKEVKWIFRYLRQSYNMGLWYLKDSGFELIAYSDANHAGCKDDCKSTSGGLQFLGGKLMSWEFQRNKISAVLSMLKRICFLVCMLWTGYFEAYSTRGYGYKFNRIPIVCDSSVPIAISYNPSNILRRAQLELRPFSAMNRMRIIIMAQQQHASDVHPDEPCPPNKRYDLMDANKKVDLDHMQCPPESKSLTNIIKNHPLRFNIATSSSIPWICMAQFWNTLKEDKLKYRLKFMLDKKELNLTLDDFRTIFHLPQAADNNHNSFVSPPNKRLYQGCMRRSTQGTHRTPRSPNPKMDATESSAPKRSTVIRFRLPERRSTCLTPPAPVVENVIDDSLPPRNNEPNILGTRLEPRSDKESLEVEITNEEEVEITNVVIPVNVNDEEEEITDEVYE
ncbi:retrovirus-related pol polyprotein from transposon TNT 1-94 [Tanacetum coccineum]